MNKSSLIADFLKDERKRLGFSQSEAAEKCGVSREIWGKYERGVTMPGSETLYAFALSGADMQYVFTGVRSSLSLSATERLFLDKYRTSEQALQDRVLRMLLGEREQVVSTKFNVQGSVGSQVDSISGGTFTIDMRGDKK